MKKDNIFSLRTVRRKILLLSKTAGGILIFSYIILAKFMENTDLSSFLWLLIVVVLVLAVDYMVGCFISKPVAALNEAAHQMANLDFSTYCNIKTDDEFGELSNSLNSLADNLQQALSKLEQEVTRERLLLNERKELVDSLSHEMKTPLGVIRAYAEGLQDENDPAKQQKYTDVIISETERMNALINTLLDLSALETGAVELMPERFEFVEFVETAAGRLLVDVPNADFELQYELPEEKHFIYTDKARMEQVLDNLILNARKNVRPDGILKLYLTVENDSLRFSIFNQGTPIPAENMDKIWTKFYRGSRPAYSGSGLGLAIVAQILSMQNFTYGVRNLSDGVEFYFVIPYVS